MVKQTYPHECCGVLLGRSQVGANDVVVVNAVESSVRAGNTRTDSAHNRYNIAPQELVKIQRQARESGWDIVGFYHSHPDHPAQWSSTDFAEAHWLGCSYVITAVAKGVAQRDQLISAHRRQRGRQGARSRSDRSRRRSRPGKGQRETEEHSSMKIHIPTPLRVYTGKQDTVVVTAATVGEALSQLTTQHPELQETSLFGRWQAAFLRQCLPERRRRALSSRKRHNRGYRSRCAKRSSRP
jgi:proteasome lid subunit RPN8/RPN11